MSKRSYLFGLLLGVEGFVTGWAYDRTTTGDYAWLRWDGLFAGIIVGAFFWSRAEKVGVASIGDGVSVGVRSVVVAHYISIWFQIVAQWVCFISTGGCGSGAGGAPWNPITGLVGALFFGTISLVLAGWATIPVGIGLACLVAKVRVRESRKVIVSDE